MKYLPLVVGGGPPQQHDDEKQDHKEKVPEGIIHPQLSPVLLLDRYGRHTHFVFKRILTIAGAFTNKHSRRSFCIQKNINNCRCIYKQTQSTLILYSKEYQQLPVHVHQTDTARHNSKERTSEEDAVAQVFSEELLPFLESPSLSHKNSTRPITGSVRVSILPCLGTLA
jgi:hypothetical protein